jgi:hypothetical protein
MVKRLQFVLPFVFAMLGPAPGLAETPSLKVSLTGPERGEVGSPVIYQITVTNAGQELIKEVSLNAGFDVGLEHETKAQPLKLPLGALKAGEKKSVSLVLTPRKAGIFKTVITGTSGAVQGQAEHVVSISREKASAPPVVSVTRQKPSPPPGSVLEEFDVFNDGDFLLVPVTVHGKTYPFVLDTGCGCTVIDISLTRGKPVREEELRRSGKTAKKVKLYQAPAMKVGEISWQSPDYVAGEDLTLLRSVSGHKFYGLLGMDFLRNYAVQIDFEHGKVRLLRSPAKPMGRAAAILFLDSKRTMPWVVGDIPGWGPEQFQIDMGCISFGGLRRDLFRALARKGVMRGLDESKSYDLAGSRRAYGGYLDHFDFEKWRHSSLTLDESSFPHSCLGLSFWRRYNLILDFPQQTMHLRKSRWYKEDDLCNLSGMLFTPEDGKTVVEEIRAGSPAAKAGLKSGDILLRLGGKDIASTRAMVLLKMLGLEGNKVPVVYQRGETRLETVLVLDPWKRKRVHPKYLDQKPAADVQASLLVHRGFAYRMKKDLATARAL